MITMSLLLTLFGHTSLAQQHILVGEFKEVRVVVKQPALAAVQPYAFIKFKHSSCSKVPLIPKIKKQNSNLIVSIYVEAATPDCPGPATEHDYEFPISSDFKPGTKVQLLSAVPVYRDNN